MDKVTGKTGSVPSPIAKLLQGIILILVCLFGLSACTPEAGIFAGGTWQSAGLVHQQIRTLTVDTTNPQNLYAGDELGHVFASTDGGLHWLDHSTGITQPNAIHALSFDATGKKLYAATDNGLYFSVDAAQQWSTVAVQLRGLSANTFTALAVDLIAPQTLYVATLHGVIKSTDDGKTWSLSSSGIPTDATINGLSFDSDNHQLWAATTMGVYRSDDRGENWQALNNGLAANLNVYTVQPAAISGGTNGLIFAGTSQGFLRSMDGGAHWAESLQSLAKTQVRAVLVDFRTPTTVYVGTGIGVLRSNDSGQNWSGIASGLPRDAAVYALELGATDYTQLLAAVNDVYLFPGTSGGFSAVRIVPYLLIVLFFFVLYRFTRRNRRGKAAALKPERIIEQPEQETNVDKPGSNHRV